MQGGKARARMARELVPRWEPPDLRRRLIVEDYDAGDVRRTVIEMHRSPRIDSYRVRIDGKAQEAARMANRV